MNTPLLAIFWSVLCLEVCAHGRSPEMIRELNASVPDWMSVAEPIKVEPIEDQSLPASDLFRPRSGGATNSRNRVQIPERGIEFQVPHEIDWRGINEEGYGVSLSGDGTKLLVNTGMVSRLYEITSDGEHREVPIKLPHVTYDQGFKGFITGWSWAGNDVLVGRAEITDEAGHEIIESRLYVFHMKEQALARLDLGQLNLTDTVGLEVASIGNDLEHLRIRLGEREFVVKADLKSPPGRLEHPEASPRSNVPLNNRYSDPRGVADKRMEKSRLVGESPAAPLWLVLAVVIVMALGLLWLLPRKQK